MQGFYYFKTLRKSIIQFLDVFNNIQIAKYNSDGSIKKFITVPLKYAPKQKFWYWLYERKHEVQLPMMAGNITGIDLAQERMTNDTSTITISAGSTTVSNYPAPTPYNINFQLAISALYTSEIDQILEQIFPFFQPAIFTTVYIPEIDNSFDMKIILNSASLEQDTEIPEDNYRTINWTLDFTAHTYLFKPINDSVLIKEIFAPMRINDYTTETLHISGNKIDNEIIYNYEILGDE